MIDKRYLKVNGRQNLLMTGGFLVFAAELNKSDVVYNTFTLFGLTFWSMCSLIRENGWQKVPKGLRMTKVPKGQKLAKRT